ncbi:MAG: hypothetical protein JXP34_14915 [Planctomycetes bacterium]|nr:hypothetical protein [Planctomycetota bacterium]
MMHSAILLFGSASLLAPIAGFAAEPADIADVPSEEVRLSAKGAKKGAPEASTFLIGPKKDAKAPEKGFALLVVLPGGDGSRDFLPFVKRIYKNALGDDWVAAQPIAPAWNRSKEIVWPVRATRGRGAVPAAEDLVAASIADAGKRVKIDPARVYLLAWSSGGPAAYAISLDRRKTVTGFFIAMSVFKPQELGSLTQAKGQAYYLLHSPDDRVCPFRMAQEAEQVLPKAGAKVKLATYDGGHGWRGPVYDWIREGVAWLDENHAAPSPEAVRKSGGTRR